MPKHSDLFEAQSRELMQHIEQLANRVFVQQETVDLSRREAAVLRALDAGPVTMGDLSARLGLALSTVTGIVARLEEKHYVARDRLDSDRRIVVTHLTAKGKKTRERLVAEKTSFSKALLCALSDEERDTLLALFRKISEAEAFRQSK